MVLDRRVVRAGVRRGPKGAAAALCCVLGSRATRTLLHIQRSRRGCSAELMLISCMSLMPQACAAVPLALLFVLWLCGVLCSPCARMRVH